MAYPYTNKWSEGRWSKTDPDVRAFYAPALSDQPPPPHPLLRTDPYEGTYDEYYGTPGWMKAGAAAASFMVLGAAKVPGTQGRLHGWDIYTRAFRGIEEYSPAGIFRTFQMSNFFSQFETISRQGLVITGAELEANTAYRRYLTKLIDPLDKAATSTKLMEEGVRLEGGQLFFGGGKRALKHAGLIRAAPGTQARLGGAWARVIGAVPGMARAGEVPETFFAKTEIKRGVSQIMAGGMPAQIVGGSSTPQYYARWANAWATESVARFNRLLKAPFEMEPFRTAFGGFQRVTQAVTQKLTGVPKSFTLGVPAGTASQMLGRLALKFGVALPAAYMGYKTLDWAARESDLLEGTLFEEGITTGIATVGVKANLMASRVAQATGLQSYRELQEEIAPGSTSLAKLAAFPLMGALGAVGGLYGVKIGAMAIGQKTGRLPLFGTELPDRTAATARFTVEEAMKGFGGKSTIARTARKMFHVGPESFFERKDWVGKLWRKIAEPPVPGKEKLTFKFLGKVGPAKAAGIAGALIGGALIAPFIPGALVPEKSPEELERIYSGEQEVPIRRGRWWEFGRSPFEGRRISYYRPHWYARMRMDAKEKAIWGDDAHEMSPMTRWLKSEFTYELEKRHYEDRPYPITATPFEDVPFIGPLLAGTIGRLIKPPQLMHTEKWLGPGGEQIAEAPAFGARVATEIGEKPGGLAESPFGAKSIIGEQVYRLQEMIGLYGFAQMSAKEALTGSPDWFDQMKQLESSRRIAGFERTYWDLELGGLGGSTEFFRRLYPHRRRQIPQYNPIRNTMPEWLPGPGEKAPDFLHGDPYTKVMEGELRLPGKGYAARFPELEGVTPDEYPLIHQFKILADVAPYSEQYRDALIAVRTQRKGDAWTDYDEQIYRQTMEQTAARKKGMEFHDYKYLSPMGELFDGEKVYYDGEDSAGLIAQINRIKASKEEETGIFSKFFGGYWELLAHNAETALDQMTPVSPGAKLVHTRSPIEAYERLQIYGTENAFWNHPVRDFFRPGTYLAGRAAGYEGVPSHIERRREIESYFDILSYVKNARLANIARMNNDFEAVKEFEAKKDETLFGLNPFSQNYRSIFRALPRRERDYFNSFAEAETEEERRRILELVPENEKALYIARWKLAFANEVRKARKAELLTQDQEDEAEAQLSAIYDEARDEGFPKTKELFAEYLETRITGESYPDWYRRVKILGGLTNIPGPDWVGWHPSVDLEDIKLKTIMNLGEDMHDYDLWPSQAETLVNKPYINNEAVKEILSPPELSRGEIRDRIDSLLLANKMQGSNFTRSSYGSGNGTIDIEIEENIGLSKLAKAGMM